MLLSVTPNREPTLQRNEGRRVSNNKHRQTASGVADFLFKSQSGWGEAEGVLSRWRPSG